MKKTISLLLALIMIFALVGCGKSNKRQVIKLTLSTEDSEAILAAAGIKLPDAEATNAAGTVVKWCSWYDNLQNYDEDEIVNTGYFTFKEKYGCEIEWNEVTYSSRYDELANLILGGTPPDCFPAGTSSSATFPMACIKGTFQPIDEWIDYNDPLWQDMAQAGEFFALGDVHFGIVTDVTFRHVIPYNRRVMDEWGFDDPAELYANDEWTWDAFYEMCAEFSDPDEERFALDGYGWHDAFLQQASGEKLIKMDENGNYYSNLDSPILEIANNLIYELSKNSCTYYSVHKANNRSDITGDGVKTGLTLFYIVEASEFTGPVDEISAVWGDIENNELMFVPLPRYENGDGKYYLTSVPTGYMIVSGAENPEGVALLASCERFKIVDPTVIDIDRQQLKEIYLWTDEMLEMYDTCYEIAKSNVQMYYNGNLTSELDSTYGKLRDGGKLNQSTWAQLKENYRETFDYYLEEQNALIDDYIEGK